MISSIRRNCGWEATAREQAAKLTEPIEAGIECKTFNRLEDFIGTEKFLNKLKQPISEAIEGESPLEDVSELISDAMATNITSPALAPPTYPIDEAGTAAVPGTTERKEHGPSVSNAEDYVVVDRQCAIEAMAYFIAETLMNCPQAATLPPEKLQQAILIGIQTMKQEKFKKLCAMGWQAYRWTALGYSAFQVYTNPWIMQCIIRAIFTFSRMTMRTWA